MTDPAASPAGHDSALRQSWALLAGICLLMVGTGLQGSLLGVRAIGEGFGGAATGLVMASFYVGFLGGSVWAEATIRRVGHIRVFAALASLASVSILVHGVFVEPLVWGAMRFVTGFCIAGILVVAESWLNGRATNDTRGRLLAFYMITSFAGTGGGQVLLNAADTGRIDLFILASVVLSLAVLPLLLSAVPVPAIDALKRVRLRRLFQVSPLGTVGTFCAGLINGTLFGMGAVYARRLGLSVADVSLFMGAVILGAVLLQWPVGRISDIFDRRRVITLATFAAAVLGFVVNLLSDLGFWPFLATVTVYSGIALSLHSLSLAYTNDYLETSELVGVSSGLTVFFGTGSVIGPTVVGLLIERAGPKSFFVWLAAIHLAVGLYALWRMARRPALPAEDQGPYVAVPSSISAIATTVAEEVHADELAAPAEGPA